MKCNKYIIQSVGKWQLKCYERILSIKNKKESSKKFKVKLSYKDIDIAEIASATISERMRILSKNYETIWIALKQHNREKEEVKRTTKQQVQTTLLCKCLKRDSWSIGKVENIKE